MREYLYRIFIIIFCLFNAISLKAATRTASSSGNWSSTSTWGGSAAPVAGDLVIINGGVTVTVNGADACAQVTLGNGAGGTATLTFNTGTSLTISGGLLFTSGNKGSVTVGKGALTVGTTVTVPASATAYTISVSTGSATLNAAGNTLTIPATATKVTFSTTSSGTTTYNGPVSISAGAIENTSAKSTTKFNGAVTIAGTGIIENTAAATLTFNSTVTLTAGMTATDGVLGVNGTVNMNGNVTQPAGTISVTSGTLNFGTAATVTMSAGTISATRGAINFKNTGYTFTPTGGTIEVTAAGTITFSGPVDAKSGNTIENITTAGTIIFSSTYNLESGANFTCSTKATTIKFGGNFTCAGTAGFFKTSNTYFTSNLTVTQTASCTFGNVIFNAGVVVTQATAGFKVAGNWTNNNTTTAACITGAFDVTFGVAGTAYTSAVGGANSTTFPQQLIIADNETFTFNLPTNSGVHKVTTNLNISGVSSTTAFKLANNVTLTVSGNMVVSASSAATTITQNTGSVLNVTGGVTLNQPTAARTLGWALNGTANATISGTLAYITSSSTAGDVINVTEAGSGTFQANAITFTAACTSAACQELNLTSTGTINVVTALAHTSGEIVATAAGTIDFEAGYTISTANTIFTTFSGETIDFGGSFTCSATTVPGVTFVSGSNAVFTGNSTVTPTDQITFANVTINSSKTVTLAGNISVTGNWTDNGSLTGNFSVTFNGTGTQTIADGNSGTETFYKMVVSGTGPITLSSSPATNILLTSELDMNAPYINLNGNTLTLGNAANSVTTLSYTAGAAYGGTFARYWPNVAITTAGNNYGTFPVGISGTYRPLTIVSSVAGSAGTVSVIHNDAIPETAVNNTPYTDNLGNNILAISQENTTVTTDGVAGNGGTYTVSATFGGFSNPGGSATITDYFLETYTGSVNGYGAGTTAVNVAQAGTIPAPVLGRSGLVVAYPATAAKQGMANVYVCGTKNLETPIESQYYTVGPGTNWNAANTWALTSGGADCGCTPTAQAVCFVQNGHPLVINTAATAGSLVVQNGGSVTGTQSLTLSGVLQTQGTGVITTTGGAWSVTGATSLSGSGASTFGGALTASGGLSVNSGTSLTMNAALSVIGTLTASGNLLMNGNYALNEAGNAIVNTGVTLTTGTSATSTFTGNITLNGTAILAVGTGTTTMSGLGSVLAFGTSGSSITGTGIFSTSSTTTITGTATISPEFSVSGTITNNGTITLNNATDCLDGTGSWIQGANSTLQIGGSTKPFTAGGTLNATTNSPNLVGYNAAGVQSIAGITYYDLAVSTSGTKTLAANAVANDLVTTSGSAVLAESTHTLTGAAGLTMNGTSQLTLSRSASGTYPELTGVYTLASGATGTGTAITISNTGATTTVATPTTGSTNYNDLILAGSSAYDISQGGAGIAINDDLRVKGSSTISSLTGGAVINNAFNYTSTGTTTLTDNLTVNGADSISAGAIQTANSLGGSGTLVMSGSAILTLITSANGSYPALTGAYSCSGTSSIVINNGSGTASISYPAGSTGYNNLNLEGSSDFDMSSGSGITVADSLAVKSTADIITISGGVTVNGPFVHSTSSTSNLDDVLSVTGAATISGGGTLGLGGDFDIGGGLTITGATLQDNGQNINITGGNWVLNSGGDYSALDGTATGDVNFEGSSNQTIGGTALITNFFDLDITNTTALPAAGVTLNEPIVVTDNLGLNTGILKTTGTNLITIGTSTASATSDPGSTTSFVDGPLSVFGANAFTFPLGNNGVYAELAIAGSGGPIDNGVAATQFTCQYTNGTASVNYNTPADMGTGLNHTSAVEYWVLTRNSSSNNEQAYVSLTSNNPANSGILSMSDLTIANDDPGIWVDMGSNITSGGVPTPLTITSTTEFATANFGVQTTFGSHLGTNPLPIQLISFTAECNNSAALVQWATASENNNNYFTVEKTQDGINYQPVATIKGNGTTNATHYYSVTDYEPFEGTSYYRLSQTDIDGHVTYFNQTDFHACEDVKSILAYSNGSDNITVRINSAVNDVYAIEIINSVGQTILNLNQAVSVGLNQFDFPVATTSGVYFIRVSSPSKTYTNKVLLIR
jgi:fibronectin-binding autotransporter adhesin